MLAEGPDNDGLLSTRELPAYPRSIGEAQKEKSRHLNPPSGFLPSNRPAPRAKYRFGAPFSLILPWLVILPTPRTIASMDSGNGSSAPQKALWGVTTSSSFTKRQPSGS